MILALWKQGYKISRDISLFNKFKTTMRSDKSESGSGAEGATFSPTPPRVGTPPKRRYSRASDRFPSVASSRPVSTSTGYSLSPEPELDSTLGEEEFGEISGYFQELGADNPDQRVLVIRTLKGAEVNEREANLAGMASLALRRDVSELGENDGVFVFQAEEGEDVAKQMSDFASVLGDISKEELKDGKNIFIYFGHDAGSPFSLVASFEEERIKPIKIVFYGSKAGQNIVGADAVLEAIYGARKEGKRDLVQTGAKDTMLLLSKSDVDGILLKNAQNNLVRKVEFQVAKSEDLIPNNTTNSDIVSVLNAIIIASSLKYDDSEVGVLARRDFLRQRLSFALGREIEGENFAEIVKNAKSIIENLEGFKGGVEKLKIKKEKLDISGANNLSEAVSSVIDYLTTRSALKSDVIKFCTSNGKSLAEFEQLKLPDKIKIFKGLVKNMRTTDPEKQKLVEKLRANFGNLIGLLQNAGENLAFESGLRRRFYHLALLDLKAIPALQQRSDSHLELEKLSVAKEVLTILSDDKFRKDLVEYYRESGVDLSPAEQSLLEKESLFSEVAASLIGSGIFDEILAEKRTQRSKAAVELEYKDREIMEKFKIKFGADTTESRFFEGLNSHLQEVMGHLGFQREDIIDTVRDFVHKSLVASVDETRHDVSGMDDMVESAFFLSPRRPAFQSDYLQDLGISPSGKSLPQTPVDLDKMRLYERRLNKYSEEDPFGRPLSSALSVSSVESEGSEPKDRGAEAASFLRSPVGRALPLSPAQKALAPRAASASASLAASSPEVPSISVAEIEGRLSGARGSTPPRSSSLRPTKGSLSKLRPTPQDRSRGASGDRGDGSS